MLAGRRYLAAIVVRVHRGDTTVLAAVRVSVHLGDGQAGQVFLWEHVNVVNVEKLNLGLNRVHRAK